MIQHRYKGGMVHLKKKKIMNENQKTIVFR